MSCSKPTSREIDRKSFILGMITAFAECLHAESKRCAFSPPFYPDDYDSIKQDVKTIGNEMDIHLYLEKNKELPKEKRLYWFVMYKFEDALNEYLHLRAQNTNPLSDFAKYKPLLGYGTAWAINPGTSIHKMRSTKKLPGIPTSSRIVLNKRDSSMQQASYQFR